MSNRNTYVATIPVITPNNWWNIQIREDHSGQTAFSVAGSTRVECLANYRILSLALQSLGHSVRSDNVEKAA